jgi:antitoxin HigA-1
MRAVPYPHPGEILLEEFLSPWEITQYRLAKAISVPQGRIGEIIAGRRGISADTALRLSKFFGTSDCFWMKLQIDYDAAIARDEIADILREIKPMRDVA